MFHESYGEIERATMRTICRYNVSPSDFDELLGVYGTNEYIIREAIKEYSPNGFYNQYLMINDRFSY